MKNIKDYLHLYLDCEVVIEKSSYWCVHEFDYHKGEKRLLLPSVLTWVRNNEMIVKPILRPLSDMTEEECRHVAWFNMDSEKHLDSDARVTPDEIDIDIIRPDGGLMVDADAAVVMELACRCFEGQLCIRTNGDIELWDDGGEKLPIEQQAENFRYLLSKGFDLFGLIEAGLAIDATTQDR